VHLRVTTLNTETMYRNFLLVLASFFTLAAAAQTRINGTLRGEGDLPLEGVNVVVGEDRLFGATTNAQGRFTMGGLRPGSVRLRATYVGYQPVDTLLQLAEGVNEIDLPMRLHVVLMREAEIAGVRTDDRAPFAQSTLTRQEIERMNTGVDLPILLDLQPSVVTTSDAGAGIGYTGIRIRGSDATRINVTMNGVPINDPESQAVFWVNMPDLATNLEDVQVQRGVGSSTNGPGAFGASINMKTTTVQREAFGEVQAFGGSFNTRRFAARFGTGIMGGGENSAGGFSLDGRLSSIQSDGYIDRASSDLRSYFLQGAWLGQKRSLRFITMSGHEVTYQAWEGVAPEIIDTNRTYNPYTYDNQVDDYRQTHYQLLFDQRIGSDATLNVTLFRVEGAGFFEQYRERARLSDHALPPITLGDTTINRTDLVRRRWLDNVMHGTNITYDQRFGSHRIILGGSYNDYRGDHFGEVIWARYMGADIRHRYYFNDARKTDGNIFGKVIYAASENLDLFGDLQYRRVGHDFLGFNNDLENVTQNAEWTFFNPKGGITWTPHEGGRVYGSVAVGNREPSRRDLVESSPASRPRPEQMIDYEAGYERRGGRFSAGINLYYMDYKDQLVLTGALNDVGYALRTNVPESYRTGAELMWAARITNRLLWRGNTTLSRNIVRGFTEHVDDWDTGEQRIMEHGDTELAFSPSVIASSEFIFRFFDRPDRVVGEIALVSKYVGRQFLDNTASEDRMLDPYHYHDVRINFSLLRMGGFRSLDLNLTLRNVTSELYESNGWVYSYFEADRRQEMIGLYPQAPFNFLGGVTVRF
jgi:iron complex outermembrane recepter protein